VDAKAKSYEVVAPEVLSSLDGLSFVKGTFPHSPMSELLGFRLVEIEAGQTVFEDPPEYRHYNPIGTVHGGFAAAQLDSTLGCAVFSTIAKGET
jgi:acyl-coenzyme A thioesterase PaaI-like protein